MYGDAKPEYEQALTTHKHHNRLHGYKMLIQREPMLEGYWTKPAFLMSIILQELRKPQHERLQWLFWVDADTIILNYEMPIEAFLPPWQDDDLKDISIVVTNDFNGFNNGVFAIKVDVLAAELFAGILAFRDFEPDTYLQWHDQSAMHNVLKQRKFAKHTVYVPQRVRFYNQNTEREIAANKGHSGLTPTNQTREANYRKTMFGPATF